MNEIVKVFEGKEIMFKMVEGEVYAKANSMCDSVKLDNWKRSANTKRYIKALKNKTSNNSVKITEFIISEEGVKGGSWIHEKLILNLARFISVDFELWCDEIIAELIREGKVELVKPSYMIDNPIDRAKKWIEEQELHQLEIKEKDNKIETLVIDNNIKGQIIKESEPKITYFDKILADSKSLMNITEIAKDYGLTGRDLNEILHEERIQFKQGTVWLLYQNHVSKGLTKSTTWENGGKSGLHTKWTQKGRLFIHGILEKRGIEALEVE